MLITAVLSDIKSRPTSLYGFGRQVGLHFALSGNGGQVNTNKQSRIIACTCRQQTLAITFIKLHKIHRKH